MQNIKIHQKVILLASILLHIQYLQWDVPKLFALTKLTGIIL